MNGYRHVLLATNFSDSSDAAAQRALDILQHRDARISLLYVIDHFPEDRSNQIVAPENKDPKSFLLRMARQELEAFAGRHGIEADPLWVRTTDGSVHEEIVKVASAAACDLIVIGSRVHQGLGNLLSHTANAVLRNASCDVLVVQNNPLLSKSRRSGRCFQIRQQPA